MIAATKGDAKAIEQMLDAIGDEDLMCSVAIAHAKQSMIVLNHWCRYSWE